jgi:hypothetical protein
MQWDDKHKRTVVKICKDMVVAPFKLLPTNTAEETEENLSRDIR